MKTNPKLNLLINSLMITLKENLNLALIINYENEIITTFINTRISQEKKQLLEKVILEKTFIPKNLPNLENLNHEILTFSSENFNFLFLPAGLEFKIVFAFPLNITPESMFPYAYIAAEKIARINQSKQVSLVIPNFEIQQSFRSQKPEIQKLSLKEGDFVMKIILGGDSGVGKSTLVEQFVSDKFDKDLKSTIGVNILVKELLYRFWNINLHFSIYDLGGQLTFKQVRKTFYLGTQAGLLVFDVTRPETFANIENWYEEVMKVEPDAMLILVGNKVDLSSERKISKEEGKKLATKLGLKYIETSALMKELVNEAFKTLGFVYILKNRIIQKTKAITSKNNDKKI